MSDWASFNSKEHTNIDASVIDQSNKKIKRDSG